MLRDQARDCCSSLSKWWQSLGWKPQYSLIYLIIHSVGLTLSRHCSRPVDGAVNKTEEVPVLKKLL